MLVVASSDVKSAQELRVLARWGLNPTPTPSLPFNTCNVKITQPLTLGTPRKINRTPGFNWGCSIKQKNRVKSWPLEPTHLPLQPPQS